MSYIKSRKHVVTRAHRTSAATLATGIALALPAVQPLHAADADALAADAADSRNLPTVNVEGHAVEGYKVDTLSGPKYLKPLVDTTQTIQIIPADLIQQQAAATLTEALRNSAGVGTFYAGENGATSTGDTVYMRGFDSSSSIYVDGVRDLGGISRDTFNVDQIEVTKGPSGSDYGRTAPSGSINLVSKQPTLRDGIGATVSWGSSNQKRATADWNTRIDGIDGAAFRLNVMAQDSGVPGRDEVEAQPLGSRADVRVRTRHTDALLLRLAASEAGQRAGRCNPDDRTARIHHSGSDTPTNRCSSAGRHEQFLRHHRRP